MPAHPLLRTVGGAAVFMLACAFIPIVITIFVLEAVTGAKGAEEQP